MGDVGIPETRVSQEELSSAEVKEGHDEIERIIKAAGDYAERHYRDDGTDKLAQIQLAPQPIKDGQVVEQRTLGTDQMSQIFIGFVRDDPENMVLISEHLIGANPWGDIINQAGISIRKEEVRDTLFVEPDRVEGEDAAFTVSVARTETVRPPTKHSVVQEDFREMMKRIKGGKVVGKNKPDISVTQLLNQAATSPATTGSTGPVV